MFGVTAGMLTSVGSWLEVFERELNRVLNGLLCSGGRFMSFVPCPCFKGEPPSFWRLILR